MENFLTPTFLNNMTKRKEDKMLKALSQEFKTMFPKRCRVLGAENLNLFLMHQQARAKHYNYLYYEDLKRYAIIAFYLGTYFDEDPLYPWVQEILEEQESFGRKVDLLNKKFYAVFDRVYGKNAIYFQEACKKLQVMRKENIVKYKTYEDIIVSLNRIYPQRMKELGKENFREMLVELKPILDKYDIHNALGYATYATLIFFMGSSVDKDPLYAWVGKYVTKQGLSKDQRVIFLFDRGLNRIRKELMGIEKFLEKENK